MKDKQITYIQFYTRKCPVCRKNMVKVDDWTASGHLNINVLPGINSIIMCCCSKHFVDEVFNNPSIYFNYDSEQEGNGYLGEWEERLGVMAIINYDNDTLKCKKII